MVYNYLRWVDARGFISVKKLVKGNKNSAFESSAPVKAAACSR